MLSRLRFGCLLVTLAVLLLAGRSASQPGARDGATAAGQVVAFDGERILLAGSRALWDAESGLVLQRFEGHTAAVRAVAISPDGARVLMGGGRDSTLGTLGADYSVRLWDVATGEQIKRFDGHTLGVYDVQFSADGRRLLSAGRDATIRIWDIHSGQELFTIDGHDYSVGFSRSGDALLASVHGTVRVYDLTTGEEICRIDDPDGRGHFQSAVLSPSGTLVVTVVTVVRDAIRLWNASTGQLLRELVGHEGHVNEAYFTSDGRRVITSSLDQTVRVWDAATGAEITRIEHPGPVLGTLLSPDGTRCFAKWRTVDDMGTHGPLRASLWDLESGHEITRLTEHADRLVGFSPDGKTYLMAADGEPESLWDAGTGELIRAYDARK